MVDDQPIVLSEQGQESRKSTPWPHPPAPAPRPWTPETHPLSGLKDFGHPTPQKPRLAVPSLREAEAARNTSDEDFEHQLLGKSAGGNNLPHISLPDVPLPEEPHDCSVGEEWTSPRIAAGVMVVASGLGSGSCLVRFLCSNLFISGTDYYMCRKVSGSLRVYFIHSIICHYACSVLGLLGCKEPRCAGVEAQ